MRLTTAELAKLLGILERIDRGKARPRATGHVGRFLRQYADGRPQLDARLGAQGIERRKDAAVSGRALDPIEVHPLLEPEVSLMRFPLGEVAETLAISDELGGLANLVLWLDGPTANAVYNVLRENRAGVRLSGDYRWTPPSRVTPGEAGLESSDRLIAWQNARCLKAVADDLGRPPHALEYVLDYRLGPSGLKYFRCVCVVGRSKRWHVLPGVAQSKPLEVTLELSEGVLGEADELTLAALLIYREPWSRGWTIVDKVRIEPDQALAHAITWADFESETRASKLDPSVVVAVREALAASGVRPSGFGEPNLSRVLLPVARDVVCWLRGR